MNFLSSCNGIRAGFRNAEKIMIVENNPVGKFNVRFIHKNNKVQFLFVEELSIEI